MSDKPVPKKSIAIALLMFLVVSVGFTGYQLRSALDGFDRWTGHEDHRLPNIRLVPRSCRWAVIDRFIELQPVQNADAIVFGDSQMFARGATQDEIFYTHWLGQDATVINFAFLAAPLADMNMIAKALNNKGIHANNVLLNINLSHFIEKSNTRIRKRKPQPMQSFIPPERPTQFQKLYQNKFVCAFNMRKKFTQDQLRTPRYRKLLDKFSYVPLQPYFANFDKDTFDFTVAHELPEFMNLSTNTILLGAPLAYDQFEHYKFDPNKIDEFSRSFVTLCSPDNPKLKCLDLTRSMTSEGFMDIIHMNARGHELLGKNIKKELEN